MKFVLHPKIPELKSIDTSSGRYYLTPKGNRYPSVTTVLADYTKEHIETWIHRIGEEEANRISKRAAKRGTLLHEFIEHYIMGEEVSNLIFEYPMNIVTLFQGIKPVLDANLNNIHLQEQALYSDSLKVAGRVDLIGEWEGILSIVDFKGSTKEKKEEWIKHYFMQASAYAMMYWELTRLLAKQIVILVAAEDGSVSVFKSNPSKHIRDFKEQVKKFYGKQNSNP